MKDYWIKLPLKCRISEKERFNYIMSKIEELSSTKSDSVDGDSS